MSEIFFIAQIVEVYIDGGWFRAQVVTGLHFNHQLGCMSYTVSYHAGRGRTIEGEFAPGSIRAIPNNYMYA